MREGNMNHPNAGQPIQTQGAERAMKDKLAYMGDTVAARQSSKALLLEHAERLRRQANQVEGLAYAVEHIGGDAEGTLYGILSGEIHRR